MCGRTDGKEREQTGMKTLLNDVQKSAAAVKLIIRKTEMLSAGV